VRSRCGREECEGKKKKKEKKKRKKGRKKKIKRERVRLLEGECDRGGMRNGSGKPVWKNCSGEKRVS
jgi:hypothetical protein